MKSNKTPQSISALLWQPIIDAIIM